MSSKKRRGRDDKPTSKGCKVSDAARDASGGVLARLAGVDNLCLGVMGGTFDPIHVGHLRCAECALGALNLDAVLFIPAYSPAFKQDVVCAPADARLAMCRSACAANPAFFVSDMEIARGGVTYTIDTMRELRRLLPQAAELWFIVGSDVVPMLPEWKHADELSKLARFAVVARPGADAPSNVGDMRTRGFDIKLIESPMLDISSSYVRDAVRRGETVRYVVPDAVRAYISRHGLYGSNSVSGGADAPLRPSCASECSADDADPLSESFLAAREEELALRVSPKRLAHIRGVAATARRLARMYGADERKAGLAGMLHDWDKGYDDEGIRARVQELGLAEEIDPFIVDCMPQVLHGPTAARALELRFPQLPADVVRAVRNHTTGSCDADDLEKILYIADAIEPTREFDDVEVLRSAAGEVDLDELFFRVYKFWTMALLSRGRVLHPDTMTIWNELAARRRERRKRNKEKKRGVSGI